MDKLPQWIAMTVVAALAVLAGGWFLLVAPARAEADAVREEIALQDLSNAQVQTQLEALRVKAEGLPAKREELAEVARKLPAAPELPDLLRALSAAASATGVELRSVSPGAPTPVLDAAPGAAAPAAPQQGGLMAVPVSLSVDGTFYDVEAFLAALEDLPRALRITGLALSPGEGAGAREAGAPAGTRRLSSTITGQVYLSGPASPAAPAAPTGTVTSGAAPAGGAAAPAAGADAVDGAAPAGDAVVAPPTSAR